MNILYIGFDIEGVGGIATYTRYQLRALAELGHRAHVVSVDKTDKRIAPGTAHRHVAFTSRLGAIATVLREAWARRASCDLVMVNHVFLAFAGLAMKAARGVPYAINVYNIDILTRLSAAREQAFARADLVIADCRYTIDRLARHHAKVPPTGLLYDPVDVGFFRPIDKTQARAEIARRFGVDLDGRFTIVTIAAMLLPPNKGHRQTIEAMAQLADPRLLYLVVGAGPDRAAIEAHAKAHGGEQQVRFLGLVDQDALPFLYAGADVASLVAKGGPGLGEAVPLGLIEASACGTAFVCGNEDGSVEAIDPDAVNGIAVDPHRPAALAEALARLRDDRALCTRMGENGKRAVDKRFRFEIFREQQGRLIAPLLGARAPVPAEQAS